MLVDTPYAKNYSPRNILHTFSAPMVFIEIARVSFENRLIMTKGDFSPDVLLGSDSKISIETYYIGDVTGNS